MLADLMVQAQAHQQQRQAAAAAAAAASRAAQPLELQNAALSYRALLQVAPSAPSPGDGGSGRSPSRRRRRSRASGGEGRPAAGSSPAAAAAAAPTGNHSMGASAAGGRLSLNGEGERSRRQAGRWNAEEVAALIEGVRSTNSQYHTFELTVASQQAGTWKVSNWPKFCVLHKQVHPSSPCTAGASARHSVGAGVRCVRAQGPHQPAAHTGGQAAARCTAVCTAVLHCGIQYSQLHLVLADTWGACFVTNCCSTHRWT